MLADAEVRQIALEKCRQAREAWRNAQDGDGREAAFDATRDAWSWLARARVGDMPWRKLSEFRALLDGPEERWFDRMV
jgi:hypothetical protein